MDVAAARHTTLAGNMANVDTPGYQRLDIDPVFQQQLVDKIRAGDLSGLQSSNPPTSAERGLVPTSPNGSNVSLDRELMLISENALRYEAMGQFVSSSLQRLKTAISGRL